MKKTAANVNGIIFLAAHSSIESSFEDILDPNIVGIPNVLDAVRTHSVQFVIFASTNHVVGGYEWEFAPRLYREDIVSVDRHSPIRPDSYYAVSKIFGEALGRYYVETSDAPPRFYCHRIGRVFHKKYDHPFGVS